MGKEKLHRRNELWYAFGFGEEDLAANRTGQMTQTQQQQLLRQMRNTALIHLGLISLFVFVFRVEDKTLARDLQCIRVSIILLLSCIGLYTLMIYLFDASKKKADKICGLVALDARSHHRSYKVQYQLKICDLFFALEEAQFLAIRHGEPYCVYYASNTRRILSIEAS